MGFLVSVAFLVGWGWLNVQLFPVWHDFAFIGVPGFFVGPWILNRMFGHHGPHGSFHPSAKPDNELEWLSQAYVTIPIIIFVIAVIANLVSQAVYGVPIGTLLSK